MMAENQTRGVSPLSTGAGVSRADCRADANYTSTTMTDNTYSDKSDDSCTDSKQSYRERARAVIERERDILDRLAGDFGEGNDE